MDYLQAIKAVQTKKPKENFLVIEFGYDCKIVLPYKDGMAFMTSFTNAEQLSEKYNEPHRIVGFKRDLLTIRIMSGEEYEQYKIAALLNISIDEVKEYALQTN